MDILWLRWHLATMIGQSEIRDIVGEVASAELLPAKVERVSAEAGQDADGDAIWRVVVVLSELKTVAPGRLAGFVRHLRERLDPEEPFPVVSFRSAHDDKRSASEAA